jgi:ketopantoate reductase
MVLRDGEETLETRRAIVERIPRSNKYQLAAESRRPPVTNIGSTEDGGFISNLIVTVPAESVVRSIASIVHRIHPTTTVCLLQDGLGVMEAVNEACFPDYGNQPLYVLGHMSHVLGQQHQDAFAVSEIRQGKLYLSAMGHDYAESDITYHPPIERNSRIAHFLDIMSTTPRLQAGGYTLQKFMAVKLHETIIQAVLEPLTVVLDCTFGALGENSYGKQMIDQLLGEILNVVSRMPELKDSPDMRWMILYGELRRDVYRKLARMKDSTSRMRSQTNRGFSSDIDYLNGYFVERGRELGVRCPVNESVIWMVKAKHQQCLAKIRSEVQLEPLE